MQIAEYVLQSRYDLYSINIASRKREGVRDALSAIMKKA